MTIEVVEEDDPLLGHQEEEVILQKGKRDQEAKILLERMTLHGEEMIHQDEEIHHEEETIHQEEEIPQEETNPHSPEILQEEIPHIVEMTPHVEMIQQNVLLGQKIGK